MTMRLLGTLILSFSIGHAVLGAPAGDFDFTTRTVLDTGDTFASTAERYRLYALQFSLGTSHTEEGGNRRSCADASIAVFAALVKELGPVCAPVAGREDLTVADCYALAGRERIDLAVVMIAQGYGFASLDRQGIPILAPYAVAEQNAGAARRDLWQFDDLQHPAIVLRRATRNPGVVP